MQLQCPCCGEQFPIEAGLADTDGKRLAALLAGMEPKLGRSTIAYLRLFSPAKRGLRMTKAVRLVEELTALVSAGSVQRDARTKESKPAVVAIWVAGMEQMLATRDRLQLPLENHNYLRAVVYGIASDPALVAQAAQATTPTESKKQPELTRQQRLQEAIGRIEADRKLGLIDDAEAEVRKQAVRGTL